MPVMLFKFDVGSLVDVMLPLAGSLTSGAPPIASPVCRESTIKTPAEVDVIEIEINLTRK
jgi:hypothetical protein